MKSKLSSETDSGDPLARAPGGNTLPVGSAREAIDALSPSLRERACIWCFTPDDAPDAPACCVLCGRRWAQA